MKIKAIVNTNLNERTEKPSVNAPSYNYYKKGDKVTIIDIVNGDPYDGNKVWYKLDNGRFIWSGGVDEINSTEQIVDSKAKINYNQIFDKIPVKCRKKGGKNVKVAIIDSGYNKHESMLNGVKEVFATDSSGTFDKIGHGTLLCGIIGGRNYKIKDGVIGVAPRCDLFVAKAVEDKYGTFPLVNVVKSLKWAIDVIDADVINFSLNIYDFNDSDTSEFFKLVNKAINKNKILVASAGENSSLTKEKLSVPASEDNFISVGAISNNRKHDIKPETINPCVNFIMSYANYYSIFTGSAKYIEDKGSSLSSAFICAIAALLKSYKGKQLSVSKVIDELKTISEEQFTGNADLNDPYKYYYL